MIDPHKMVTLCSEVRQQNGDRTAANNAYMRWKKSLWHDTPAPPLPILPSPKILQPGEQVRLRGTQQRKKISHIQITYAHPSCRFDRLFSFFLTLVLVFYTCDRFDKWKHQQYRICSRVNILVTLFKTASGFFISLVHMYDNQIVNSYVEILHKMQPRTRTLSTILNSTILPKNALMRSKEHFCVVL